MGIGLGVGLGDWRDSTVYKSIGYVYESTHKTRKLSVRVCVYACMIAYVLFSFQWDYYYLIFFGTQYQTLPLDYNQTLWPYKDYFISINGLSDDS